MRSNSPPLAATYNVEQLLSNSNDAQSSNNEITEAVIAWIHENHAFFSAAMSGQLPSWIESKISQDKKYITDREKLVAFTEKLNKEFAADNTKDVRVQFNPDAWACFVDGINGLKDEGLRYSSIESNQNYEILNIFLTNNMHIAHCLNEELPKLTAIAELWEEENFHLLIKDVIAWVEKNKDFLNSIDNGQLENWISGRINMQPSLLQKIATDALIAEETKNIIIVDMENKQNIKINKIKIYWEKFLVAVQNFKQELNELFELADKEDGNEKKSIIEYLTAKKSAQFLAENIGITKYLVTTLPTFDYGITCWKNAQKESAKTNSKEEDTNTNKLVAASMEKMFAQHITTSLDQPPQITGQKRNAPAAENNEQTSKKRMTIYPVR